MPPSMSVHHEREHEVPERVSRHCVPGKRSRLLPGGEPGASARVGDDVRQVRIASWHAANQTLNGAAWEPASHAAWGTGSADVGLRSGLIARKAARGLFGCFASSSCATAASL